MAFLKCFKMISKYRSFIPVIILLVFNSCNLFKKSKTDGVAKYDAINLDTLEITTAEGRQYQSSATRINDIIHTKLDVSFNWAKQYLYGKATITIKPYFYPTSTLELDARGMELREVSLIKAPEKRKSENKNDLEQSEEITEIRQPLEYVYENDVIKIKLDKEYKKNEQYTVFIDYVAKPNELKKKGGSDAIKDDKGLYFINPEGKEKDKPQQIWTQGETQSNSVWFPTIDRPNERMTDEIYITVDKKYATLSNGELIFSSDNGDSTRTDCWRMDLPHAPYLVMMAIGDFAVVKDRWRDKEVSYYLEKEYAPYVKNIFGNTPEMLEFFSNKLGVEFAWNKYSQVVVRDYVSGAMENTTATLHGEYLQRTDRELLDKDYEDVISHELFHQWFGDLVTCESWSNLPLNESFATYGEYLWKEYKYGTEEADLLSEDSRNGYLREASRKQVNLIRYQYEDKEDMFDGHSYNKGGQVLHMLRKYVGDEAFFAALKLYLETNKFSSVEIHNLRLAFEQVTGEDLNWFFNQWFLSSGHPVLLIKTHYDTIHKKQKVQIVQTQDLTKTPLFKLPMYIDIYSRGKKDHHKITVTKVDETFEFDAALPPYWVNADADKALLCVKYESKTIDEQAFQYRNGPLYLDRSEALNAIAEYTEDSLAAEVVMAALNDPFWKLRIDAIIHLKVAEGRYKKQIREQLIKMAKIDRVAAVRGVAINYLSSEYKDEDLKAVYENALDDRSYNVIGMALSALAKLSPQEGLKLAKKYEEEKSMDILFAIADLYANYGSDDNNKFFINTENKFTSYSRIGFVSLYGLFLQRDIKNETVISGVQLLKNIAQSDSESKWVAYYAKKTIRELITMYEARIADNTEKLKGMKANNPEISTIQRKLENDKAQKEKITQLYSDIKSR